MWTTSLDLTDAYFHIPISPKFRKFLRFVWEDRVYAFKAMPFGLSTAPLVFTRIFQAVVAHLHSQSIFIHSYLDDSLLKNMSQFLLRDHTHFVIGLLLKLGFLISWKKSELGPSQDFILLGEYYRTDLGLVFPPEEKIVTLKYLVNKCFQISSVPARQFLQLIGFLISLMDVIPLGRLHIRPIQWYLREFWHPVTQMWEACIPVLPRLLPHLQWWLQRSNLLTGVPLNLPRIHTDSLHRCLPNRMGCLPRRENSVRGVGRLSFRRTHKSSGNEGSFIVIETLPRSDSKTVSDDSHIQYDSGGLSSESRRNSLLFSVSSMQRNTVAM